MIIGIGIDTVDIARFAQWHQYSQQKLLRIFSAEEIDYCLAIPAKSAERFALRFAAREALYKALCYALPSAKIPFLTLCKQVCIRSSKNEHGLQVSWDYFKAQGYAIPDSLICLSSFTHTDHVATAIVLLQTKPQLTTPRKKVVPQKTVRTARNNLKTSSTQAKSS